MNVSVSQYLLYSSFVGPSGPIVRSCYFVGACFIHVVRYTRPELFAGLRNVVVVVCGGNMYVRLCWERYAHRLVGVRGAKSQRCRTHTHTHTRARADSTDVELRCMYYVALAGVAPNEFISGDKLRVSTQRQTDSRSKNSGSHPTDDDTAMCASVRPSVRTRVREYVPHQGEEAVA